ncbi:MAG: acyl-CoA synthetase [Pseudomonadota bacterium]
MGLKITPPSRRVMNLGHFLKQTADRCGSRPALARGEDVLSFSELNRQVERACLALRKLGVSKGDRVLVQSRNSFEMFAAMFAVFRLGAVLVPVNFRLSEDDVVYIAGQCGASVLLYDSAFTAHRNAVVSVHDPSIVIALDAVGAAENGDASWAELIASVEPDAPFEDCQVEHDDPCWFFFTSGTTGHPKAAVLTHGQMGFVVTNHIADLMPGLGDGDASLVVAPLSHGAGIHQLAQVARGVVTVLLEGDRFNPGEVFATIERWRITNMFLVPTILKMMVESEAVDMFDHSSLRHVIYAGAPTYRVDQQTALRKLGKCIVQYFGLGEVTGNITVFPAELHDLDDEIQGRIGSCGYARTGMQVQVQDGEGTEVARGQTGELCVIGPAVFVGYYNNPDANAKAFRNGWFRTGDLGHMDEEGFIYITGRDSDMYISGGSNIYPREIEEKLLQYDGLSDCAVVGLPDAKWGEIGCAAIVVRDRENFDLDDFRSWMAKSIARYKIPHRIELFDALPVSGYGKITKKLVRAAIEERDSELKR